MNRRVERLRGRVHRAYADLARQQAQIARAEESQRCLAVLLTTYHRLIVKTLGLPTDASVTDVVAWLRQREGLDRSIKS